ncbi:MAG: hypothetical protein JWL77_1728 [Chthonomonadaceae bacterium]|nr:hypothetical protein [Chthonomonadaceae bacterium]
MPHMQEEVLLTDAQMRRFVTDGYLILNANVAAEVHEAVYERLQWLMHQESNPGNNVLPAVPEMQSVLDSPTVRGALTSVLGRDYVLHPHRFAHNNEPGGEITAEGAKTGKGSHSFVGWHQDDHSPLSRPRHHFLRYAMILYYPQDTPNAMGPTQLIPGTHLNRAYTAADRERGKQGSGPAGTCILVHFDIVHGGSFNAADRTRHMVKFVFARVEEPSAPTWDCRESEWRTPADHEAPAEVDVVWRRHWDWLSGRTAAPGEADTAAIPALMAAMEAADPERQEALYTLAALGEAAVALLIADLASRTKDNWNEGIVVMENSAYALGALGAPAVPALIELLDSPGEWVQINALFALGEIGSAAQAAYLPVLQKLRHPAHPVVRTALDALGQIGVLTQEALPDFRRLLLMNNPDWQTPMRRAWTGQDQVRTNAMMALLRLKLPSEEWIDLIVAALPDPCGYVGGFGVEILRRRNTPRALRAALDYLCAHRWDNTLKKGVRTF